MPLKIKLEESSWSDSYSQPADSNQKEGDTQYLYLSSESAGSENFLVIETDRWAIDVKDIEKFAEMLKLFMKLRKPIL